MVPDIKPDILNTIRTNGTICIKKKEVMDGKVKIEGSINVYIMYLADDQTSSIRSLNNTLDFSQIIDFEAVREGMILENNVDLKSIECRVLNGRKVNVKAIMDIGLKIISDEEIEFVKQIENLNDIQLLNEDLKVNSLLGTGITKVYAKDTLVIENIDNLSEIIKTDINIINKETKISYNKVLIKADCYTKIIYLTDDNRICSVSQLIPIMGFIDMPNVTDENICDVKYEIKNIFIKPNNIEEHSIYVEIEIEVNCMVHETKQINVIQDLYSPSVDLVYNQKQIQAISQKEIVKDICTIREKQFISEIANKKIYDVDIKPTIINQTVLKDRILYEGELNLNFLFNTEETNKIGIKNIILPFTFNMDCIGAIPTSQIETNIEITLQDFIMMPDESIDIKIDLEFLVNLSNNKEIQVIEEINVDETRQNERYSLIIYFVKPGDTLWKIAKKFRSTISNIVKINAIEDENKIDIGQQLFIPTAI